MIPIRPNLLAAFAAVLWLGCAASSLATLITHQDWIDLIAGATKEIGGVQVSMTVPSIDNKLALDTGPADIHALYVDTAGIPADPIENRGPDKFYQATFILNFDQPVEQATLTLMNPLSVTWFEAGSKDGYLHEELPGVVANGDAGDVDLSWVNLDTAPVDWDVNPTPGGEAATPASVLNRFPGVTESSLHINTALRASGPVTSYEVQYQLSRTESAGSPVPDGQLFRFEFSPIPEPATVGLFGVGLLGLMFRARTRRSCGTRSGRASAS